MAFIDYYKILGVDKSIPQSEVQAAYRKRVKQFHPDLHPNDPKAKAKFQALKLTKENHPDLHPGDKACEERFKEGNEAYEVLSDPEKRKKYDQYGEHWQDAGNFGGAQAQGSWGGQGGGSPFEGFDFSGFSGGGGFSSFFQDLFGGGMHGTRRTAQRQRPVPDMEARVGIDMYTASAWAPGCS